MASTLRIWASEHGESHLEVVDLPFEESDFPPPTPPMHLTRSRGRPATSSLASHLDRNGTGIGLRSGNLPCNCTIRPLKPGTILLADDTTGKGHKTRVTGTEHTSKTGGRAISADGRPATEIRMAARDPRPSPERWTPSDGSTR